MKEYPQVWVGYRKGWRWWFHNLMIWLDHLDRAPKIFMLALAGAAPALASLSWPGLGLAAARGEGVAARAGRRASLPAGGTCYFFALLHGGAGGPAALLPLKNLGRARRRA